MVQIKLSQKPIKSRSFTSRMLNTSQKHYKKKNWKGPRARMISFFIFNIFWFWQQNHLTKKAHSCGSFQTGVDLEQDMLLLDRHEHVAPAIHPLILRAVNAAPCLEECLVERTYKQGTIHTHARAQTCKQESIRHTRAYINRKA